ncbi:MAG TPA: zinc-binding dehydrogenase [Clostridiaceae bacterium]|nr:zinc-binding dehydrogenase [Clostridiaceae bacterium]
MRAAYLKAPFQFEVREVNLREIKPDEVLVKVMACSVCGHDMILASYAADYWQPFGHEIAGVVEKVGPLVKNVQPGDKVVLESGTFDRYSDNSRNGRVDLDNNGPNFWLKDNDPMGFADYIIVPNEVCVKFDGLSFEEACLIEPLGVAMDLVLTADIKLNDDVLVIGLGPIGLMALKLAKAMGARKVYGAELSVAKARIEMAKKFGADEIICTDLIKLEDYKFEKGGLDRILVTAPPKTIPSAINIANKGGIIAFLGIDYGPEGSITFDSNVFHVNKLQLRSSFASPALYFPKCIDLVKAGIVETKPLITHRFKLEDIAQAITSFRDDRAGGIKAVMINS